MKDRLQELQLKAKEDHAAEDNNSSQAEHEMDELPEASQAIIFEEEPFLENFLMEAQRVREDIDRLAMEVKKFGQQQKMLVATMRRFSILKTESDITRDIKQQAESVRRRLENMAKQTGQQESDAFLRVQRGQHAVLAQRFQQVMRNYNDSLLNKQDKCKEFIVRQLEVCGREVTEEELEEMTEEGHWEVFNENHLNEVRITRAQLGEIEQRRKELEHLESNVKDLRDLFLEVHLLVLEQGEHIDNIQSNVEKTKDYVWTIKEKIKMAARYKRTNPLRKMFCCCCPWKY